MRAIARVARAMVMVTKMAIESNRAMVSNDYNETMATETTTVTTMTKATKATMMMTTLTTMMKTVTKTKTTMVWWLAVAGDS
jgi:hypothetical protein